MKFNFRFDSILKVRRHQEKKEKQKLGVLFSKKAGLEDQLYSLEERCRTGITETEKQSVVTNRHHYAQKHAWHKRLTHLRQQLGQVEIEIERQRKKLAEANTRTRMMEKLKKNEKTAFIREAERVDQLQQNEIAIQRYNTSY